mgnify:FL=1
MVDEKLAFAKENGADMVVNPSKENLIEAVKHGLMKKWLMW